MGGESEEGSGGSSMPLSMDVLLRCLSGDKAAVVVLVPNARLRRCAAGLKRLDEGERRVWRFIEVAAACSRLSGVSKELCSKCRGCLYNNRGKRSSHRVG